MLLAFAALAPAASAQIPTEAPASLQIRMAPVESPVGADGVTTTLEIRYCYHSLGSFALAGTKVTLKVDEQPAWTEVAVSPSSLTFEVGSAPSGSQACASPQSATVTILPLENATAGAVGEVRIAGFAHPNAPIGAAQASDAVIVKAAGHDCHHAEAAAVAPEPAEDEGTLTTQSAGAGPAVTTVNAAVAALGVAGAGAGALVAARRRGR